MRHGEKSTPRRTRTRRQLQRAAAKPPSPRPALRRVGVCGRPSLQARYGRAMARLSPASQMETWEGEEAGGVWRVPYRPPLRPRPSVASVHPAACPSDVRRRAPQVRNRRSTPPCSSFLAANEGGNVAERGGSGECVFSSLRALNTNEGTQMENSLPSFVRPPSATLS